MSSSPILVGKFASLLNHILTIFLLAMFLVLFLFVPNPLVFCGSGTIRCKVLDEIRHLGLRESLITTLFAVCDPSSGLRTLDFGQFDFGQFDVDRYSTGDRKST